MHEVGVISQILATVEKIMDDEQLSVVEAIVLDVGELSGVVPHYMEECWPAAVYKTRFENTKLEMNVIEGELKCNKCGKVFNGYKFNLKCPECKNTIDFTPLSGRELMIKEIRGN